MKRQTIEFQAVSSHQTPRVRATVLGVKVQWRDRPAYGSKPAYCGWICDSHGLSACDHSEVVEAYLPPSMVRRMIQLEERQTGGRR